jgi:hypothetical protein
MMEQDGLMSIGAMAISHKENIGQKDVLIAVVIIKPIIGRIGAVPAQVAMYAMEVLAKQSNARNTMMKLIMQNTMWVTH